MNTYESKNVSNNVSNNESIYVSNNVSNNKYNNEYQIFLNNSVWNEKVSIEIQDKEAKCLSELERYNSDFNAYLKDKKNEYEYLQRMQNKVFHTKM